LSRRELIIEKHSHQTIFLSLCHNQSACPSNEAVPKNEVSEDPNTKPLVRPKQMAIHFEINR
jgi:hypothetical protein